MDVTAFWDALGWSILHSLWQGALIGLVVYGLRLLATDRRAWLRYLIGMGGLIATFAAFMVTFVILMADRIGQGSGRETIVQTDGQMDMTLSFTVLPTTAPQSGLAEALVPWLGMVWAIGFACLSLQAYRAWAETRRLATTGLSAPEGDWSNRFASLIRRSRSSERIRLFVSDYVSGPLTLGAVKPIVLVPAGFLTSMPPAHVEAILLHELAHIRRHDFLMGLIQTAIKTVLYFNPAVLILSRQIDEDREQACDDMAVAVTGQPADLVRGLAALRLGPNGAANELVMAADGGPLLTRLNRLMGRSVTSRSTSKLSAAAISALMLGTAAYSTVSLAQNSPIAPTETPEADAAEPFKLAQANTPDLPDTVVKAPKADTSDNKASKESAPDIHVKVDGKDTLIINTEDGNVLRTIDGRKLAVVPPMPVMPAVPALPPMPAMPAIAPVPPLPAPVFSHYDSEDAFEEAMEAWGEQMEDWGDTVSDAFDEEWEAKMESWEAEVEARFEGDWESKMEAWGEEMEAWGEKVEIIAEGAGEAYAARLAEIDVDAIREEALRSAEKSREWTERRAEREIERNLRKLERKEAEKVRAEAEKQRAKAEKERRKAEQQRIKAQQDRMKAEQDRAKALQDRTKAQQDRAKAQQQRVAANIQTNTQSYISRNEDKGGTTLTFNGIKDGPTVKLNGQMVNIGALHEDVMSALRSDRLIDANAKTADLSLNWNGMMVNGKAVPDNKAGRYKKLLKARGFDLEQAINMSFQKDGLSIALSGKGSKSTYTYTDDKPAQTKPQ